MTGKPFHKTRTIISEKILSSRVQILDVDTSAMSFKDGISKSINAPRLNINLAIKSLGSGIGAKKKPTYENTDNKTRTNSGGEPGMVVGPRGIRYQPKEKNGPGKELVLFPSLKSRESNGKTSNFGWLKKDPNRSNIKNYIEYQKKKPQIRIRKFKVNPKTDEVIPGSDIEMSPFSKDTNAKNSISEKMLPGKTIGSRESSLITRSAGKFGIVRDALNKFRCPPGTPAANQFTDNMGSNCFGQSAGDLVDFAIDAFRAIGEATTEPNSRQTLAKFFKDVAYDKDNGRFGAFFARTIWRDADGNKIRNIRKWNSELRDGEYKIFTGGMANAQLELETQDARIANLRDLLGVPSTPETRKRNDDVHEIFRILKEKGMLNVTLGRADPTEPGEGERPTYEQVMRVVTARLSAVPGFNELPSEQKKRIIDNDAQRFYETERALLEGFLDEYVKNPEHMGTIKNLVYQYKTEYQDEASWTASVVNGQAIGEIRIDIPFIMDSQETMLPQLANDERLRIDVTGAKTDAEAAKYLGDFLLTTAQYSKQHAATVEERGFARHIIKHEIAHSIQGRAFFDEITRQINENGFVLIDGKKIESLDDMTGEDLIAAMSDVADSVNLEMLNSALSRTDVVMFLAGAYPRQDNIEGPENKALEATAELWALRNAGLIWGDDVDAALEWMDNIADSRIGEKRARSDVETMRVIQDSYYLSPGESSAPWYVPEDPVATAAARKREESKVYKKGIEKLDQDLMLEELSTLTYEKDLFKGDIDAAEKMGKDTFDLNNQLLDLESREKIVRSVWTKKYGTGESDAKRLKLLVDAKREASASFTPDVLKSKTRAKKITALKEDAAAMDDLQEIIEQMADYDLQLRLSTDIDKKDVKEERKIYMDRYRDVLEESGDSRSWVQQKREMEDKIDQILRPTKTAPLVKPDTPTTDKKATDTASKMREELLRGATPRQRIAVLEFSDSKTSDVAKLLDPELRQASLERMKERSRLLKGAPGGIGGVQFDAPTGNNNKPDTDFNPASRWASTPEQQVENILIPTMEIIDKSKIGANLEIEAEIELDVNDVTGDISLADVAHESFISGRVVSKNNPFSTSAQLKPSSNGKQKRRVIIQTTEDDRGIFPHWSMDVDKDDKRPQQLVLPPGKLKVIEIRDDGTVVMQISEQKDTESVLDSLVSADIKGTRFSPVVDRYITERRENKIPREQKRSLSSRETQDRGVLATRELKRKGGRFGQGVDDDDMDGLPPSTIPTRSQTRAERIKSKKENISDVKGVLTGEEPTKFKSLSRDSIDPEVAELIVNNQPEEVIKLIEDSAVELHNSMDKRTRVRMRESELNDFTLTGTYNPRAEVPVQTNLTTEATPNNRRRRRGRDFKSEAKTIVAAEGARDEFKKLKAANMGNGELHKLDDAALLKDHGLVRSAQKSVISDDPVYVSNSAEQAIALLALGYQVEVPDTTERKMVKNAALQTESELKIIAEQEADGLGLSLNKKDEYVKNFMETHDIDLCGLYQTGKNVFCNENIGINREHMPQSSGTTRGADSPALRAMVSGHVSGNYESKSGLSDEDVTRYKDITKKLGNPKTFNDVSTEDREWAFGRTDWSQTEPKTEKQLMEFLSSVLPDGDKSIVRKSKDPDELFASQKQLRNSQIDKSAEDMLQLYMQARDKWGRVGTEEFTKNRQKFLESKAAWFQGAILTSRDGYIVDGHHRWAGIKMLNDHLPENERIQVQVNELQTPIVEALTLAKVFQEDMGIKGKTVGKVVPYQDGEINPMSKADFDTHMMALQTQVREKVQDIKDKKIYPFEIKNLSKNEPRSPGLKDNRQRSVSVYGMDWKPEYSGREEIEKSKKWDKWDDVPLTELDLSSEIRPTESHLKGSTIDSVVSGETPYREGYHPNIVIDTDGKMYVSDGHNRVAMNRALGNEKIQARVIDLRKTEPPWGEQTAAKSVYKGYDLIEPPNPMPKDGQYPIEVVEAAEKQRAKIKEVEKEITETLIDLAEEHDSVLINLAYRMKSIKSLARKINDEKGTRDLDEVAEEMSDVVRYTGTFSPQNYVAGASGIIEDLKKKGYSLRVKNYWKGGDPYQGINIAAVHPNGTRFELQFHTPQSAIDKEVIHKIYDDYKDATDPKKRFELYNRMVRMAARIELPVNEDSLYKIGDLKTQGFSPVKSKSARTNAITRNLGRDSEKQPITRKSAQIIDAAMSRAGFSWEIRKKVSSAIVLISSYDANNSHDTICSFAKNVNNNSGPIVAKMSVKALAAKERIPLHASNEALSIVDTHKAKHASDQEERNIELAFNLALKILINMNASTDNQEYKYQIKSEESDLVKSERFKVEKGSSADNYRLKYEEEIGIPSDTPNLLRPISGYVVNKSHIDEKRRRVKQSGSGNYGIDSIFEIQDKDIVGDGLTADGEIEVVLRPETANRVAYGRGNSFDTRHHPVMLDSTEREDIVNAITVNNGLDKDEKMLDTMLHLLGSSKDKNFSHVGAKRDSNGRMKPVGKIDPSSDREHEIFEASILGGFSKDEVEGIHYPFSKVMKLANEEDISDVLSFKILQPKLQKLGFTSDETKYFASIFDNTPINTPSIQKLKEYRAAQKIKKKYESAGIGYVKFAHPTGINIENPRSYNKTANLKDNPELVIKQNIASEIDGALKDMLKKMRKNKTRELIGDPL